MKFKKELNYSFTQINNNILKNKNLSTKSKGLYCIIFSLPNDWNYSIMGLVSIIKEKESFVASGLKELEEFGLIKREYYYNSKGHKKANYLITDKLFFYNKNPSKENPSKENPSKENPSKENPSKENQVYYKYNNLINKDNNKELNNKEIISNEITKKENKTTKKKYGEFKKVRLTNVEKERLIKEYGEINFNKFVQELDEYKEMHNKIYANDNLVIRKWVIDKVLNNQENKYKKPEWKKPKINNKDKNDVNSWLNDHKLE